LSRPGQSYSKWLIINVLDDFKRACDGPPK
jgi:hypothetical protein